MYMIRHATYPIGFALALSHRSRKKCVGFFTHVFPQPRLAIFGTEDQMHENV